MKITLKLFATLTDYLPGPSRDNALELEVAEGATVAGVIEQFKLPPRLVHLVLIDGAFVPPGERPGRALREGEVLAIWPPIAGG